MAVIVDPSLSPLGVPLVSRLLSQKYTVSVVERRGTRIPALVKHISVYDETIPGDFDFCVRRASESAKCVVQFIDPSSKDVIVPLINDGTDLLYIVVVPGIRTTGAWECEYTEKFPRCIFVHTSAMIVGKGSGDFVVPSRFVDSLHSRNRLEPYASIIDVIRFITDHAMINPISRYLKHVHVYILRPDPLFMRTIPIDWINQVAYLSDSERVHVIENLDTFTAAAKNLFRFFPSDRNL